ncbi:MAG: hypothetical protein LQ343_007952 [Gyalolechia ehrenbergii]|nr:MAG: hypothetical protein LQ343_007952 [Gyalolechia ehrenbergii]
MTADEVTTEVRALKRRFLQAQRQMGTYEEAQDKLTAKHLKLEHQMQAIEKERDGLIEKGFKAQRDMQAYEEAHDRAVEKLRASGLDKTKSVSSTSSFGDFKTVPMGTRVPRVCSSIA